MGVFGCCFLWGVGGGGFLVAVLNFEKEKAGS